MKSLYVYCVGCGKRRVKVLCMPVYAETWTGRTSLVLVHGNRLGIHRSVGGLKIRHSGYMCQVCLDGPPEPGVYPDEFLDPWGPGAA